MSRSGRARLLISAIFAVVALALVAFLLSSSERGQGGTSSSAAGRAGSPTPLPHVREQQAAVFEEEAAKATAWALAHPSPTPEPTATPWPWPLDVAAAELPYGVPPPGVAYGPEERWVAVNVTTQRAYAFIGGKAAHVALVTTGMPGFETPLGEFRINYRKEKETMDSETLGVPHDDPEGYFLEDVYFAQYFYPTVALHSNYWRPIEYFGHVASSHGCVGMLYDDAKFYWEFATYGTRVVVYK